VATSSQITIRVALVLLWFAAIVVGTRYLLIYENTAAQAAQAPESWPSKSKLVRPHDRFTLVMLAHPNCPCTRASLAELEIVMAQLQGKVKAFVLFSKPSATEDEVRQSSLWKKAASVPNVSAVYDTEGLESHVFQGEVSGQTMLYGPKGRLIFTGGITSARGHQGDNEGAEATVRIVRGDVLESRRAPVFGCALHNPNKQALKEDPSWRR